MTHIKRAWVNQPSTHDQLHHLHGRNVIADYGSGDSQGNVRIFFVENEPLVSQLASINSLSIGWKKENNMNSNWKSCSEEPEEGRLIKILEPNQLTQVWVYLGEDLPRGCLGWKYASINVDKGWLPAPIYYPGEHKDDIIDVLWSNETISTGVVADSVCWPSSSLNHEPLFYRVREERRGPKITHEIIRGQARSSTRHIIKIGPWTLACSVVGVRLSNIGKFNAPLDIRLDPDKINPSSLALLLCPFLPDVPDLLAHVQWLLNLDGEEENDD